MNVFAWSPYEVPKVNPKFIVHRLNVDTLSPPPPQNKKQKPKRSAKKHVKAIRQEVKRLKEAGAIKEVSFRSGSQIPQW